MRKAQISSKTFIYIIAAVISVIILLVGYKSVSTLSGRGREYTINIFETDLVAKAGQLSFGSSTKIEFELEQHEEICFADSRVDGKFPLGVKNHPLLEEYPLVRNHVFNEARENVFLLTHKNIENRFEVENLVVQGSFLCSSDHVWLVGFGDFVLLTQNPYENPFDTSFGEKPPVNGTMQKNFTTTGECSKLKPCTVSPVDLTALPGPELVSVYSNADYPTLEEALKDNEDREVWLHLLPIPGTLESKTIYNSYAHILIIEHGTGKSTREISNSVHLIGDPDASSPYLKPAINTIFYCPNPMPLPKHPGLDATPEELANYLRELAKLPCGGYKYYRAGIGDEPLLHFKNSLSASIEGLYFGKPMEQSQEFDKPYYDDLDNTISPILIEDSNVDIKDCDAYSGTNTDWVNGIPTSWEEVNFNRVAFAVYDNSAGVVERVYISNFWAGGILAKESTVTIKNSMMHIGGRWFCVAGVNSDLRIFDNAFYAINDQRFLPIEQIKNQYPTWIGPVPLKDFPVYGTWVTGGSIEMKNNVIGEYQTTVALNNVGSGEIKDNIFIVTYGSTPETGVTIESGSASVSIENNVKIEGYQQMLDNLNFEACKFGSAYIAGYAQLPLCYSLPKQGSIVERQQVGPVFGDYLEDWQQQEIHHNQHGCTIIPTFYFGYNCAKGLTCSEESTCV